MSVDYNGRTFIAERNSAGGEVGEGTIFRYHQEGTLVWGTYAGGAVRHGMLIALADADGRLDMRYQHVNDRGELMTGVCRTVPELASDGRLRLHETWRRTCGGGASGASVLVEIAGEARSETSGEQRNNEPS